MTSWKTDVVKTDVVNNPKLHPYVTFKTQFNVEPYILSFMNRSHRSYLAQLSWGILPIHIETCRWDSTDVNDRVGQVCYNGQVEDEIHLIFHCNVYSDMRNELHKDVWRDFPTILGYSDNGKTSYTFSEKKLSVDMKDTI